MEPLGFSAAQLEEAMLELVRGEPDERLLRAPRLRSADMARWG